LSFIILLTTESQQFMDSGKYTVVGTL